MSKLGPGPDLALRAAMTKTLETLDAVEIENVRGGAEGYSAYYSEYLAQGLRPKEAHLQAQIRMRRAGDKTLLL